MTLPANPASDKIAPVAISTAHPDNHGAYVVGFMFNEDDRQVALVRKQRPLWQSGLLNGIGGKVEPKETVFDAMSREFREETGCDTTPGQWRRFCEMQGTNDGNEGTFRVDFFVTRGDLATLRTRGDEEIVICETTSIGPLRRDTVANVPWLVPLAIDYLHDGRPTSVLAIY